MNDGSTDLRYPKLREDITFTRQVLRGKEAFIVKDPVRRKFMQFDSFGAICSQLCDGTRTVEKIVIDVRKEFPEYEISHEYVSDYIENLKDLKLILRDRFEYNVLLMEREKRDRDRRNTLLHMRFPAFSPDASLEWLRGKVWFLFTRPFAILYLTLVISSYLILLFNLSEVLPGLMGFYSFSGWSFANILTLYIVVILIIIIHEYGHGLTCKYFGGEVPAMGILIIYLINPALYCNVSDSYRFPKKSQRLWVVAAGAVVELFIGAIAVYVWWLTDPTLIIHDFAFKIIIFCSITSLLFNMNPLLKYDGYYALAEWLEIPNLRKRAFARLGHLFRTRVFGLPADPPRGSARERRILLVYGIAATCYSITIFSLIFVLLRRWLVGSLHALGWILVFLAMYILLKRVLRKGFATLKLAVMDRSGTIRRHLPIVITVLALLLIVPSIVRLPTVVKGTGTLEPYTWQDLEAPAPGFVVDLHVASGVRVEQGQLLAVLRSDSLQISRVRLEREEQRARAAASEAFARGDAVAAGQQLEEIARLEKDRQDLDALERDLSVTAPLDGVVLTRRLRDLKHRFVSRGETLLKVGVMDSLRVRIEVGEREMADVEIGMPVKYKSSTGDWSISDGRVIAIDFVGDVRIMGEDETLRPAAQYRVEMVLHNYDARLVAGQSGRVRLYGKRRSLWAQLLRSALLTLRLDFFI
jgi:putative peptide zinc metalloprotease protein